jgi:23S rRNA pseudouridine1911/1915/1917 synthase
VNLNKDKRAIVVPDAMSGQRLDYVLADLTQLSRSRIKALLKQGHISPANQSIKLKPSQRVCAGDTFYIDMPANQPMKLIAENIPLDILYEDAFLLIVNKPPGMVVHPSHGHDTGTLVHALLHHCPNLPGINGVERPGIVHRIDKNTSGSLVIAKTEAAHHGLVKLFSTHDINRQYLAWCRGTPAWRQQTIEQPIGRHPNHRQKMAIVEDGKPAITDAMLEKRFDTLFSRIRLTLHTGRTHQIRVHLASLSLPILGDDTYARNFNPPKTMHEKARDALLKLQHQALHAEVLGFVHPITGVEIQCIAPLPQDLSMLNQAFETSFG